MVTKKVVIFGLKDFAELAYFYLTNDSDFEVVAFTANKEYCQESHFYGLPIVPFEELENYYPPIEFNLFAPMSGVGMNKLRRNVFEQGKQKGFTFISYISSKATVFQPDNIGENCFILEDNTIQPFTTIGDNVVLWSGNHIGHHGEICDHVFFTSHVVLSGHCLVESYCFLGVNSTIRDGIVLAEGSFIAMSASITKNTAPWGVYLGSPAKKGSKRSDEVF
ncbi:MAG: sugar O-acyltransferase (sialic acid O-acetyltransferase NeuD family) [Paraglaciecola sp.]|jgi:sugar O-acyltransferase (sialic acid O-acetyltransferase NeuD family)